MTVAGHCLDRQCYVNRGHGPISTPETGVTTESSRTLGAGPGRHALALSSAMLDDLDLADLAVTSL